MVLKKGQDLIHRFYNINALKTKKLFQWSRSR